MKKPIVERQRALPAFKRIGTYLPLMLILGIAVPAMIYLAVMQSLGWRVPMMGTSGAFAFAASRGDSVILYNSPTSKAYFSATGGNYDSLLVPWRNYFSSRKVKFEEVKEAAGLQNFKEGVLILPSAVSLDDSERAAILAFRDKGGSILATWATGSRGGRGDWTGWEFLNMLGAKMLGEIPAASLTGFLIPNGESPVSHTLDAGQRVGLTKVSEKLLRFQGEMVAARFMDWARTGEEERRNDGAIIYTEADASASRSVLFAFSENVWESRPLQMYSVIDDSLQWLRHEAAVVRANWPNGKRAAEVIEMDTEEGFANATAFANAMQAIDYRATFYVLTSVGRRFPEVLSRLARDFEVGYHADVHDGFKGQPAGLQSQRLQIMRGEMSTVVPDTTRMTGFRAPLESYDATTEVLLQKFGIRHHTADPGRTDARLPFIAKMDGVEVNDALVILPRTQRDDINMAGQNLTVEQTAKEMIDDFDLAVDSDALGLLSVHTQNFHPENNLYKAMPAFLERVKQRRPVIWLASAGQVADWWRQRERFKLSTSHTGKRVQFDITVTGDKPLIGASLILMLPQKGVMPVVQALKISATIKPTVAKLDDYRATIVFDTLEPGNYSYQATFAQ